jgi:Ca-activated chloride channel family protein
MLIKQKVGENDFKKNISENFKWASAVTEFALLLRDSQFKGNSNFKHVVEVAQSSMGSDPEGFRTEFIKLVKTAELLKK